MLSKRGLDLIKSDEGLSLKVYKCPLGFDTIGYGHKLSNPISQAAADQILVDDIQHVMSALMRLDWFNNIVSQARKDVIVNMAFNLGVQGLLNFKHMIKAIEHKRFDIAAYELMDSKFARQVTARAKRLAQIMKTGKYE